MKNRSAFLLFNVSLFPPCVWCVVWGMLGLTALWCVVCGVGHVGSDSPVVCGVWRPGGHILLHLMLAVPLVPRQSACAVTYLEALSPVSVCCYLP